MLISKTNSHYFTTTHCSHHVKRAVGSLNLLVWRHKRSSGYIFEIGVPRHEYGLILQRDVDWNLFEGAQLLLHEVVYEILDAWQTMLNVEGVTDNWL